MEKKDSWTAAYEQRSDLDSFGSAGLALFAMALKFGYDDLETIGADAVVDGPDDRGCDVVYIDREKDTIIIAQSYRSERQRESANASKAASLRQAVSFLVEAHIDSVPARLKASAEAVRSALRNGDIESIYVWFVHNCPGSKNVKSELEAVKSTVHAIVKARFPSRKIDIFAQEISSEKLEELYTETSTPILVNDPIEFMTPSGFKFNESSWSCFVAPLPLSLLKSLYKKYETSLFSANVRDFLGMRAGESNINYQMQKSLTESPDNFFVYNNGLTILTHKIAVSEEKSGMKVKVNGFSIVNGAQTTGTIGTSSNNPPESAYVLARFISTTNDDLITDVVRYNNSQNAITASDFRSTDSIQRRLVMEMKAIPEAEYDGGRRGGISAAIKRRPKLLPSYSVGQAIAAVHGDPTVAYNEKSAIWSKDVLYSKYFNDDLTATHIVLCYSILRAVEEEKKALRAREMESNMSAADQSKLEFYRRRGSVFLMAAAIGECLETIADTVIPNRFSLSFGTTVSPDQATKLWVPAVEAFSNLSSRLDEALSDGLKNAAKVRETIKDFSQLVASLKQPYASYFSPIRSKILVAHNKLTS
jgi:hypothetical protein